MAPLFWGFRSHRDATSLDTPGRGRFLRRLFSNFAHGWPGAGLLLLRLVAGIALIYRGAITLWGGLPIGAAVLNVVATGAGFLLFAGLWTPVAGALLAVTELVSRFLPPGV